MNTLRQLSVLGFVIAASTGCGSLAPSPAAASGGSGGSSPIEIGPAQGGGGGTSPDLSSVAGSNAGAGGGGASGFGGASGGSAGNAGSAGSAGMAGSDDMLPPPAGWNLVWSDEFNGPQGQMLDQSKWQYDVGPNDANMEQEYYTDRPENSGMDGQGNFIITALHEDYMGHSYTSAKFTSSGKFEPTYGRFEARVKLPAGKGLWPAFWALGTDIGNVGWPSCGEMDIMETVGDQLTMNHGSLHGPGYSGSSPLTATYTLPNGSQFDQDFHVFAAEWEENVVRFYVDDQLYETRTPADVPSGKKWVYDHSVFLIMNVAVGGTWPGDPDNSIFPRSMAIDYVRVYSR